MKGWASTRRQLAATLVFAVLVTGGLVGTTRLTRTAGACEQVLVASSQEKASMLQGFAASYDAGRPQVGGQCVTVRVEKVDSGDAELALANGWTGPTRPEVWSPASSAWVNLLDADAPAVAARILPVSLDFLFESPLVIGMPQPMALALGYKTKAIGWALILHLAQDPRGWGAYGRPDWGKFKLGKTNPTISTSGLHALIGAYYAAPGGGDLSVPTITSAPVKAFVGAIEASVVHYGQTATDFLQHLRYVDEDQGEEATLRYISAIALEEQELADYNAGLVAGIQHSPPHVKLVAIYPSGGTPVADHPYVVLGWSTDGQKAAALDFENFIKRQGRMIEARHFRFGDNPTPALASLVYPDAQMPALVRLEPPAGPVLKDMLDGWKSVRKSAHVLILIDAAAAARTLTDAISTLASAASGFEPQDRVGVWTFPSSGGQTESHTVVRDVTDTAGSLAATLAGVKPVQGLSDLETALHDAVQQMVANYDPSAINAVLVL
ncbi:MAG TPA: substrate-binding domain-containing protein, partial [Acidimicrobiales bacterium]|nr:substrate-binding domain-containing protein [Acidimicrobiales bacterium]